MRLVRRTTAAAASIAIAVTVSAAFAETSTVDDLAGLRPDTDGVQTNAFWDTHLRGTYTVKESVGASTNAFDTSVLSLGVSNVGNVGGQKGFALYIR